MKKWAVFTSIAIQMAVVILGGAFFGRWLDTKFPNDYSAFTIVFSLLGVTAAMYFVIKQLNDVNKGS